MSAYAALKAEALGETGSVTTPSDVDDDILQYAKGSEDECSDDDYNESSLDTKVGSTVKESTSSMPVLSKQSIFQSDFLPSETNLQFGEDSVSVRLERGDFVMVQGMFKLKVLHGVVRINNCYELNSEGDFVYTFFTTNSHALPIIANASTETQTKDDLARIKLINYHTGFNDMQHNFVLSQPVSEGKDADNIFQRFTFQIVIEISNNCGLFLDDAWVSYFTTTAALSTANLIVIGNKNSGKSTFCKSLSEYLRFERKQSVVVMDLDPGQSDNSSPYCMSLSIQMPTGSCSNSGYLFDKYEDYYGFTSPMDAPTRYLEITRKLYSIYLLRYKHKGMRLIINTPGWIKGFGKTLLQKVTSIVSPSDLVVLTNNLTIGAEENQNILQSMDYVTAELLPGVFRLPLSSPSHLRTDNKLMYFHHKGSGNFDFSHYLLSTPPERISYIIGTCGRGIYGVSILNYKVDANFDFDNIPILLSSSIWGVYSTESACDDTLMSDNKYKLYPNLVKSKNLESVLGNVGQFLGLLIIHSINTKDSYLNVYAPPSVSGKLRQALKSNSKIVLVRGEGSIPPTELMYPGFLQNRSAAPLRRMRANLSEPHVPYLNTKGRTKVGGIWKVRRNILRKSHRK
ncbi:GRC3 [Candida margitis]|uniref:GRC3 n=1 Tax=Candida margitis TaxID=1775924 RepID=UPI002226399A|nr:GRC3 [Candida margitis]KAI5950049.1 GRC3 [Candida margitis]